MSNPIYFRRFCFAPVIDDTFVVELLLPAAAAIREIKGVHALEVSENEENLFVLLDTDEAWDCKKIRETITGMQTNSQQGQQNILVDIILGTEPLERIFEMDQIEVYPPASGQLKICCTDAKQRFVMSLKLQSDPALMDEYRKVHAIGMAWPQITKNMKQMGIKDMELYLFGTKAFLIMDTHAAYNPIIDNEIWGNLPKEKEWQEYVSKFQQTDPQSSITEKWKPLIKII